MKHSNPLFRTFALLALPFLLLACGETQPPPAPEPVAAVTPPPAETVAACAPPKKEMDMGGVKVCVDP